MKKSLLLIFLLAASSTASAGFFKAIPYYGNNPYLFCTLGMPSDCWLPGDPVTGSIKVVHWSCFNPVSAAVYKDVCPKAFPGAAGTGELGSSVDAAPPAEGVSSAADPANADRR